MHRVLWSSLGELNRQGYLYVWANLFATVISLPIITAPLAWAGLVHLTHQAQLHPQQTTVTAFWDGIRQHLWTGLVMGALNVVILGVNFSNLLLYESRSGLVEWLWLAAIGVWISLQFYFWALLEEMEQTSIIGGLRNALIMLLKHPLITLQLWVIVIIVGGISTIFTPMWFLLTLSFFSILTTRTTLACLAAQKTPTQA